MLGLKLNHVSKKGAQEEEAMTWFWEEDNYLPSPIPWSQAGVDLGVASWLFTGLFFSNSAYFENRASLACSRKYSYRHAFYQHGWMHFIDAVSRCWTIYLAEKWFYFLNGAVEKNRTITKLCFQVRGCQNSNQHVLYICTLLYVQREGDNSLICRCLTVSRT